MKLSESIIGIIGAGNMGEAFISAMVRSGICASSSIRVSDINNERLEFLRTTYGVKLAENNDTLFNQSGIVILAVKPQQMDRVLQDISDKVSTSVHEKKLVISIAAGVRIQRIENIIYKRLDESSQKLIAIIRVMPNTPALVLAGMAGMAANANSDEEDILKAEKILQAMGHVVKVEEEDLDGITALSGSGPAYVYYFIESLIQAGIKLGFDPEKAVTLTMATVKGAVKLMEETGESPAVLRRKVTSPGGTTEAALKVLGDYGVKDSIVEAVEAAARRSMELSDPGNS